MPGYLISPAAAEDIASILAWTHDMFGAQARLRYESRVELARLLHDSMDLERHIPKQSKDSGGS